jgi:lauroyl/myristoyl acyltransferase
VLTEAGLPTSGALRADMLLLRRRRRHRRFRRWLRRNPPELAARAMHVAGAPALLAAARAGGGAIIVTSHGGPQDAASLAFRTLGLDVLEMRVARAQDWDPPPRMIALNRDPSPRDGGRWLVAGLREVRAGGVLRIPIDGFSPSRRASVRVMGVSVPAAGGMASLARLSAAPVFPMTCVLDARGRLHVRIGPALDLPPPTHGDAAAWEQTFLDRAHAAIDALFEGRELEQLARVAELLRFRDFEATLHGPQEDR